MYIKSVQDDKTYADITLSYAFHWYSHTYISQSVNKQKSTRIRAEKPNRDVSSSNNSLHSLIKYSEQRRQLSRAIIVALDSDHRRIESKISSRRHTLNYEANTAYHELMELCKFVSYHGTRPDLVCLAYSTMQRWRVRVFALVSDEIYLYYQVVRALESCNNIYLPRQPRVPFARACVHPIEWNPIVEFIVKFYVNRFSLLMRAIFFAHQTVVR